MKQIILRLHDCNKLHDRCKILRPMHDIEGVEDNILHVLQDIQKVA